MSKLKLDSKIIKEIPKKSVILQLNSLRVTYLYCPESTLNLKNILGDSILEVYTHEKYVDNKVSDTGKGERVIFLIKTQNGYFRFSCISSWSLTKIN
jgi:hypothetical protein